MSTATEWEVEAMRLEAEVAQVCGVANATAGRLVTLIADVLATGSWEGADILSPAHWVGWKCGVSPNGPAGWCPWPAVCPSYPRPGPPSRPVS